MAMSVPERLAVVETKVGEIHTTQEEMAGDLRIVRDYVLAEKAKKQAYKRIYASIGGVIAAGSAVWGVLETFFRR
jgi:hypothetical protein